jgi:hypothetical protein
MRGGKSYQIDARCAPAPLSIEARQEQALSCRHGSVFQRSKYLAMQRLQADHGFG